MSGFCVSAARLASPDAGLISYGEMLDTGRYPEICNLNVPHLDSYQLTCCYSIEA